MNILVMKTEKESGRCFKTRKEVLAIELFASVQNMNLYQMVGGTEQRWLR